MNVFVIGNGGRESAIIWRLLGSKNIGKVYATGNGGMYPEAGKVDIPQDDFPALSKFAKQNNIGLTIVAMDDLLAAGIVDYFQSEGLRIFGPTKAAARIEWSKSWAKYLMAGADIPTASFRSFNDRRMAKLYALGQLNEKGAVVIKADGLALGKGVVVCTAEGDIELAINSIMKEKAFGDSGNTVVIEEFLEGPEVSFHVLVDNAGHYKIFPITQDHKKKDNGDTCPNTGGMGVIGPVPIITAGQIQLVENQIIIPLLAAMEKAGAPFRNGVLYPGLILTKDGPKVLEVNARFGDPETQVYMALMKSDLLGLLNACVDGTLDQFEIEWFEGFATCVAMASEGYPGKITKKDAPITGVDGAEKIPGVTVFYAGASQEAGGPIVNSGGRVLYCVAWGATLWESIKAAYRGVVQIHFEGCWYRVDIGAKCLNATPTM